MKVGIVGLGLMGGSFGRVLVKKGHEVFGTDRAESVMLKAEMMRAITCPLTHASVGELDLLVIALMPEDFASVANEYLDLLKPGAIMLDFCGVKRSICAEMSDMAVRRPDVVFVGGHPMAGREFSGIEHSSITLFDRASMILVNVNADIFALDEIKRFFLELGFGKVVLTTAENHDAMVAYTSQLCHVVSNAFIKNDSAARHTGYSAGSYRDLTRVARLNPAMWTELIMQNRDKTSQELDEFISNLLAYKAAVDSGDREELMRLLAEGNERKLAIDTRSKGDESNG